MSGEGMLAAAPARNLTDELAEAEARVAQIKRRLAAATCREAGCDMQSYGGANAGCDLGGSCGCSVPVNVCTRCGDCDYGDNAEARRIREECAETDPERECICEGGVIQEGDVAHRANDCPIHGDGDYIEEEPVE